MQAAMMLVVVAGFASGGGVSPVHAQVWFVGFEHRDVERAGYRQCDDVIWLGVVKICEGGVDVVLLSRSWVDLEILDCCRRHGERGEGRRRAVGRDREKKRGCVREMTGKRGRNRLGLGFNNG